MSDPNGCNAYSRAIVSIELISTVHRHSASNSQINLPSITLSPQVEALRLDLRVQLGQTSEESLQNFPGGFGSKVGGIFTFVSKFACIPQSIPLTNHRGVDHGVAALNTREVCIFKGACERVKGAHSLLRIGEACGVSANILRGTPYICHTCAEGLGNKEHVGNLVPRVRVDIGLVLLVDMAGAQLCMIH